MRKKSVETLIRQLKHDALESCQFRGHTMSNFVRLVPNSGIPFYRAACVVCSMDVDVRPDPQPNQCDIAGEAVALSCDRHLGDMRTLNIVVRGGIVTAVEGLPEGQSWRYTVTHLAAHRRGEDQEADNG